MYKLCKIEYLTASNELEIHDRCIASSKVLVYVHTVPVIQAIKHDMYAIYMH